VMRAIAALLDNASRPGEMGSMRHKQARSQGTGNGSSIG